MQPDHMKSIIRAKLRGVLFLSTLILLLNACVSTAPKNKSWSAEQQVRAQVELGLEYLKREQLDVARELFEKALEIDQSSSTAYHGLGLVEAKSLNLSLAREYLKRAVLLDSDNLNANSDYAVVLCETKSARQGIERLEQIKKVDHGLAIQLALGRCYEGNHQFEQAEVAYKSVLSADPTMRQALLSMAHLKYKADNFLSARAFVQRYFSTNTVSSDALLLAAKVENNLRNLEDRDRYARRLWARYPTSKQATQARELFSK